jgi:hypothetical protein
MRGSELRTRGEGVRGYDLRHPARATRSSRMFGPTYAKLSVAPTGPDRARRAEEAQRITVRSRAHDCLSADIAAGTRAIFNDELLTRPLR